MATSVLASVTTAGGTKMKHGGSYSNAWEKVYSVDLMKTRFDDSNVVHWIGTFRTWSQGIGNRKTDKSEFLAIFDLCLGGQCLSIFACGTSSPGAYSPAIKI